jgi:ribosomal protein L37E
MNVQSHTYKQTNNGTKLQCQRCGRQWIYHGRNPYFALCTFCKTTVSIRKNKIESLQSAQVDRPVQTTTVATTTIPKGEGESST